MSDNTTPRRLYGDKDISRILKRATEMQEAEGPTEATGLSLEEIQQIAAEVGVDPKFIQAAVAELDQGTSSDKDFHLLGSPVSFSLEHVVEGEITDVQWEEMVEEIRQSFKLVGGSGKVGRSFEWTHDSRNQQTQVTVASRGGQTKIRVFSRFPRIAILTFVPAMVVSLQAGALLGGSMGMTFGLPVIGLMLSFIAATFLAMRFAFSRIVQKKERKAHQLLGRLEQIVAESNSNFQQKESVAISPSTSEALLDTSLTDEEIDASSTTSGQTRRRVSS